MELVAETGAQLWKIPRFLSWSVCTWQLWRWRMLGVADKAICCFASLLENTNITCIPAPSSVSTRAPGFHRYFCAKCVPRCVFEMERYRNVSYRKAGLSRVVCWNANVMTVKRGSAWIRGPLWTGAWGEDSLCLLSVYQTREWTASHVKPVLWCFSFPSLIVH